MRVRRLDQHPRAALALIAGTSAAIHAALSLLMRSPVFTPDEWLYAQLSHAILAGHPNDVLGSHLSIWSTTSYVGPAITSPFWLIDNVGVAYHLSLFTASVAFGLAAFPAYGIARKSGLGTNASLVTALFSQIIPAGVFTATLLAEPYAYPALLLAVLIAIEAIAAPTLSRATTTLLATAALLLIGGMQFFVFPIAVVVAWVAGGTSKRSFLLRALATTTVALAAIELVRAEGEDSILARIKGSVFYQHHPFGTTVQWFGVNAFVLALASGWVIVPAAVVGLCRALRMRDEPVRILAWLCFSLTAGVLVEAAIWGASGYGLYERFTFYTSPLLTIFCLRELGHAARRAPYALLAYAGAAVALLLPLTPYLVDNLGHSPTLLGLSQDRVTRIAWPIVAAALAIAAAALGTRRARWLIALGAAACVGATGLGFTAFVEYHSRPAPNVRASKNAALLVSDTQVEYANNAMRMLFWNPNINRIIVLDGSAPDLPTFLRGAVIPASITATTRRHVRGPLVVGEGVSAWLGTRRLAAGSGAQLTRAPDLVAFGWGPHDYLLPYSELFASGARHGLRHVEIRLTSLGRPFQLIVTCTAAQAHPQRVLVPRDAHARVVIDVPSSSAQDCRLSVAPGSGIAYDERKPVARASLVENPPPAT